VVLLLVFTELPLLGVLMKMRVAGGRFAAQSRLRRPEKRCCGDLSAAAWGPNYVTPRGLQPLRGIVQIAARPAPQGLLRETSVGDHACTSAGPTEIDLARRAWPSCPATDAVEHGERKAKPEIGEAILAASLVPVIRAVTVHPWRCSTPGRSC